MLRLCAQPRHITRGTPFGVGLNVGCNVIILNIYYKMLTFTSWFKLNDGKLFPGQSPRRFSEPDRKNWCTRSMSPYQVLTYRSVLFFSNYFSSVKIRWEIWTSPGQTPSLTNTKQPPQEGRPRDGQIENVCNFSGASSLENGVDIGTFVGKTCEI